MIDSLRSSLQQKPSSKFEVAVAVADEVKTSDGDECSLIERTGSGGRENNVELHVKDGSTTKVIHCCLHVNHSASLAFSHS